MANDEENKGEKKERADSEADRPCDNAEQDVDSEEWLKYGYEEDWPEIEDDDFVALSNIIEYDGISAAYEDGKNRRAHQLKSQQTENGYLGKLFGGRYNAPVNIASFSILLCLIAVIILKLFHIDGSDEMISALISFASAALGYLFGADTHKKE